MKLSLCITTFNRAKFIGATLESILSQLEDECEVVVVDGASTDNTEQIVSEYVRGFCNLRYVRRESNQGIDRDYDYAVQMARGEYCWFMSDDDLLKPGAITRVLSDINCGFSMLLVNYERCNNNMSSVLLDRFLDIDSDILYRKEEIDRLFSDTRQLLIYIGSIIIRRSVWLKRNRDRYYDTTLMHIGVVFQEPLPASVLLISEPLISYRQGNPKTFLPRMFEIFFVTLPSMVSTLPVSDTEKRKYYEFLGKPTSLLLYRAMGWYSFADYRRWIFPNTRSLKKNIVPALIALCPGLLVNSLYLATERVRRTRARNLNILRLRMSPYHFRNYRILGHR